MLDFFPASLIPVVIFLARIIDVSLGTLRIIYVARGMKLLSAVLGFIEVLIWLVVITQIMQNLHVVWNYLAFAGGFAAGNFVGIWLENKLMVGNIIYRIVSGSDPTDLIKILRRRGYGVTKLKGEGMQGEVHVLFTVVKRRRWREIQRLIESHLPQSFYSVEEVKQVRKGKGDLSLPRYNRILGSILSTRKSI